MKRWARRTKPSSAVHNACLARGVLSTAPEQVLRQKLRQEFELGQASIARDKASLVEGTKTSLGAMQLKLKREAELKERIAAFAVFNKNAEKAKKLSRNLQARPCHRFGVVVPVLAESIVYRLPPGHGCSLSPF